MPPGSAHGRDLARQPAINIARPPWQRAIDGFDTNTKLRNTQQKDRKEVVGGRFSKEPNPNPEEEQEPLDAGEFKNKSFPGQ